MVNHSAGLLTSAKVKTGLAVYPAELDNHTFFGYNFGPGIKNY
jgi:hypothetical protein